MPVLSRLLQLQRNLGHVPADVDLADRCHSLQLLAFNSQEGSSCVKDLLVARSKTGRVVVAVDVAVLLVLEVAKVEDGREAREDGV